MPKSSFICAVLITTLGFTGCGKQSAAVRVPPLPDVAVGDVPGPASTTVLVSQGDTLEAIAKAAYGHESFSQFVGDLNRVASAAKLQAGAKLETPSLSAAFVQAGLSPQYQPAINVLSKVWTDIVAMTPEYLKALDAGPIKDGGTFEVPERVRNHLTSSIAALDAAMHVLKHPDEGHLPPLTALRRFEDATGMLRTLAAGRVESRDYDLFLMGKSFGLGFAHLLTWVETGYQSSK